MTKQKILVTGANGQLGQEIRLLSASTPQYDFVFLTREELPVDQAEQVKRFFKKHLPQYCINCAAYTAVDKAETEKEIAFSINADAPGFLASACREHGCLFIHISTDYVFDGTATMPYTEESPTHPQNVYGASKLAGEQQALMNDPNAIIIRTSWVYSSFGKNFVKTMLRLMNEKEQINVVNDQWGSPTYAADLAEVVLAIIDQSKEVDRRSTGIFHYSSQSVISWYDFAVAIKELTHSACKVLPIPTSAYPTPAKRPAYSALDSSRIRKTFHIAPKDWKENLATCIRQIGE